MALSYSRKEKIDIDKFIDALKNNRKLQESLRKITINKVINKNDKEDIQ